MILIRDMGRRESMPGKEHEKNPGPTYKYTIFQVKP